MKLNWLNVLDFEEGVLSPSMFSKEPLRMYWDGFFVLFLLYIVIVPGTFEFAR